MIITPTNAVHYLIERGLLTFESAVDGDLMIVGSASNHRNTQVIRKSAPGFFIKQIQKWDAVTTALIQREAACYWLGNNDEDFAAITRLLPKYYYYDLNRHLLVTELLSGGENLFQFFLRTGAFPAGLALQIGQALGTYNGTAGNRLKRTAPATLAKNIPWILTVHRLPAAQSGFNALSLELLKYLQGDNRFYYVLDALQKRWRADSFIHGDIKFDNFIVEPQNTEPENSFKIIDWELAGFGDAAWDLGSGFQAFITFPLISLASGGARLPVNMQELMQLCSAETCRAVREFWVGYAATLPPNQPAVAELLERGIKSCAARMMQLAFECTETLKGGEPQSYSDVFKAKAYSLLFIALDTFLNPVNALQHLFSEQP